jgi:ABC-type branched-subunit amino acid transport system substrate-binding protein
MTFRDFLSTVRMQAALFVTLCCVLLCGSATAAPFTVEVSAPLSGDFVEYGTVVRRGFEMAALEWPSSTVQVVFEDNQYSATKTITAHRALTAARPIDLLFLWGEVPYNGIAPLLERSRTPTIVVGFETAIGVGKEWIIVGVPKIRHLVAPLAHHLTRGKHRAIALVVVEDPFYSSNATELQRAVEPGSVDFTTFSVLPTETDFRSTALRIKKGGYDAVGVLVLPGQIRAVYKQLATLGVTIPSFGTDSFESRDEVAASGPAIIGSLYSSFQVPDTFATRYREKYRDDTPEFGDFIRT